MQTLRRHQIRLCWIAFVAIFALALVPTVSRWLAAAQGGSAWAEICTPQGPKPRAVGTDEQPTPSAALHLDHCAFCGLAGQGLAPAPMGAAPLRALPLAEPPPPFLNAPCPLFAWAAAQARAPPFRLA
ncbi:MAG TPA: DUF2946 family protein [Ideonella sp.]|uniref:DUF2946 family protein n=1 Tax=Ideonella sp. TaxID=1929293 RepID=UPI002E332E84|nr:DUF2946 family protein [Ideonella sp.]HEX5688121.1 DUF2946 family protein [Ideonella sp.]